ncbi:hypothetical protein [uncultured Roseibium sp.]|uniref:hypothetical protein n=1 Tax=uncultured Roseibium sp. TaxID=1936171 RepID=UPI0026378E00|nr:hypothetical protein [uncultured Roseibium sp.]
MSEIDLINTIISVSAICGLLILLKRIRTSGVKNNLEDRFEAIIWIVSVFLTSRIVFSFTGADLFRFMTFATAAVIPLGVLLLTERLLRRHAPRPAKILLAGGAFVFVLLALFPAITASFFFAMALLAFQLSGFVIAGVLVVLRDRSSLSPTEDITIKRVSLSLVVILPCVMTDFQLVKVWMPVQLSGLAILVTCWLFLSMWQPKLQRKIFITVLTLFAVAAGLSAAVMAWRYELNATEWMQTAALVLSVHMLALIIRDALYLAEAERQNAVFSKIGFGVVPSLESYLEDLSRSGVLDGTLLLGERHLSEFDNEAIGARFGTALVLASGDLPVESALDTLAESQLRALFDRYAATHLILVSRLPLTIAVMRQPGFTTLDIDPELQAAFRIAQLVSQCELLSGSSTAEKRGAS